jgi:hypothetical protein
VFIGVRYCESIKFVEFMIIGRWGVEDGEAGEDVEAELKRFISLSPKFAFGAPGEN